MNKLLYLVFAMQFAIQCQSKKGYYLENTQTRMVLEGDISNDRVGAVSLQPYVRNKNTQRWLPVCNFKNAETGNVITFNEDSVLAEKEFITAPLKFNGNPTQTFKLTPERRLQLLSGFKFMGLPDEQLHPGSIPRAKFMTGSDRQKFIMVLLPEDNY